MGNFAVSCVDAFCIPIEPLHTKAKELLDCVASSAYLKPNHDVTQFSELRVHFWYYPGSMDNSNDDFYLDYSSNGGVSWKTVKRRAFKNNFVNNRFYEEIVYLYGMNLSFTSKASFRCDASDDFDRIFIDEVELCGR